MSENKPTPKRKIRPRQGLGSYVESRKKVQREYQMPVDVFMRLREKRMRNR